MIFGIVPRWIAIVVLLIVVLFVVFTVCGATKSGGQRDPDAAPTFNAPSPDGVLSLFYRPVRIKADVLGGTCSRSGTLIAVGTSTCSVTVPDSGDKARELKLRINSGAPVSFAVTVGSTTKSKVGQNGPEASLGLTDKAATINIFCASGCSLTVKS